MVAEIPSTRLRQKSVVLARNAYNITSIICNILITRQLNAGAWNWGGKAGFFWGGVSLLALVWVFFRLPEPKNRTYAELDALFERRTSARKFASISAEELVGGEHETDTESVEFKSKEAESHVEHA